MIVTARNTELMDGAKYARAVICEDDPTKQVYIVVRPDDTVWFVASNNGTSATAGPFTAKQARALGHPLAGVGKAEE